MFKNTVLFIRVILFGKQVKGHWFDITQAIILLSGINLFNIDMIGNLTIFFIDFVTIISENQFLNGKYVTKPSRATPATCRSKQCLANN
jgi:hypothetical protein